MVKILSKTDKEALTQAISEAEHVTSAELVVVVSPASDAYQSYILLYGLMAGSTVTVGLWAAQLVTLFPLLLAIQLAVIALLSFIPWLRHLCLRLVPKRIRHHRAAHRAYEEYLNVSRHVSATTPIVLLYVSLAEHYTHILNSRSVREHIPDKNWNAVIDEWIAAMQSEGLRNGCIKAIRHATELLIPHFPEKGEIHNLGNTVIEIGH